MCNSTTLKRRSFLKGMAGMAGAVAGSSFTGGLPWIPTEARAMPVAGRHLIIYEADGGKDSFGWMMPKEGSAAAGIHYDNRPMYRGYNSLDLNGTDWAMAREMTYTQAQFNAGNVAAFVGAAANNQTRSHNDARTANGLISNQGIAARFLAETGVTSPFYCFNPNGRRLLQQGNCITGSLNDFGFADTSNLGEDARALAATLSGQQVSPGVQLEFFSNGLFNAEALTERIEQASQLVPTTAFPSHGVGRAFRAAWQSIMSFPNEASILVIRRGGHDTHSNQLNNNVQLCSEPDQAIQALYANLEADGLQNSTVVITNSEFGRTARNNQNRNNAGQDVPGTDHGEGGIVFAWGPSVQGGIRGGGPNGEPDPADFDHDRNWYPQRINTHDILAGAFQWLAPNFDVQKVFGEARSPINFIA